MSHVKIERRQQPRQAYFDTLFLTTLDEPRLTFPCLTIDISAEGVRILAEHPLTIGRLVELWLRLENEPGTFLLRGQIRWCNPDKEGYRLGIAVEANGSDGQDWKALLMPVAGTRMAGNPD